MIFVGTKLKCSENNLKVGLGLHDEKPATNLLIYDTDHQLINYGKGNREKGRKSK
jgi:hypothetical protein